MKKKIAVYTSTRADFGLLNPLIAKLIASQKFDVRIFVTGTHLDPDFGLTIKEIENSYAKYIHYRVPLNMKEDSKLKNLGIMSQALQSYGEALASDLPDISIVLGDRYEALCYGLVCASLGIPIAHLHGGELTFGAIDDKFRHCLTKLSNWHFVACETYDRRVVQMGENPDTVFNVGALGVDNALNQQLISAEKLEANLGAQVATKKEVYLFTFHPETNSPDYGAKILKAFLANLGAHLQKNKALVIITGVNSDPGASIVRDILKQFENDFSENVYFKESLGLIRYLSVMKLATAVLGNSSSGILESFSMRTPSVNIGFRQEGREREEGVIDLPSAKDCAIFDFNRLLKDKKSLVERSSINSLFGNGHTSTLIVRHLEQIVLDESQGKMTKIFFDI